MRRQNQNKKKIRDASKIFACIFLLLCVLNYSQNSLVRILILIATILLFAIWAAVKAGKVKRINNIVKTAKKHLKASEQMERLRNPQKQSKSPSKIDILIDDNDDLIIKEKMLRFIVKHITEKLRQRFPEAIWTEIEPLELNSIVLGHQFRIQLFQADTYNYAEVWFDKKMKANITLLRVDSFSEHVSPVPEVPKASDSISWYENYGGQKILDTFNDASCRGLHEFFITETGEVKIIVDGVEQEFGLIDKFPIESEWGKLLEMMQEDDIHAETSSGIVKVIVA